MSTEHRPVPLPNRGRRPVPQAEPAPPGTTAVSAPASRQSLDQARRSKVYYDGQGRRRIAKHPVPIDDSGTIIGVEFTCRRCKTSRWVGLAAATKGDPPMCEKCSRRMAQQGVKRDPLLPWGAVWRSQRARLYPVLAGGAVATVGTVAAAAGLPAAVPALAALPLAEGGRRIVRSRLVARAVKADQPAADRLRHARQAGETVDLADLLGPRRMDTIARRARTVAYCTTVGCVWTALAAGVGVAPHGAGKVLFPLLAGVWLPPAASWWRRLRTQRTGQPQPESPLGVAAPVETVDPFEALTLATWDDRLGGNNKPLAGTRLTGFSYVKGGWRATAISAQPGAIEPERWRMAAGRIAAAYRCGVQDVTVELDTADASQAVIRVQQRNPLCEILPWPGPAQTWDFERGLSTAGRFGDEDPAFYRWWNEGGPWHDLIAGATGSGKSELVNNLLLSGLHSNGLVLDWVIDTQWGQSYGEFQDLVDWFAPTILEARLLLLAAVKEMRRRNRIYSRRRQKTWRPTLDLPLLVITIDEAHEVLKDTICLALVEMLANMSRKTGIKLRIITQVPTVDQIGGSTPIKDALVGGNLIVFRTGSPISTHVSIGPVLQVDPHKIPPEWPKGSPAARQTTAGVGYMAGASRREALWRSFYLGDNLKAWLYDEAGTLTVTPGVVSQEMAAESGPFWGNRRARIAAMYDAPLDDSDILPGELVEALALAAAAASVADLRRITMPQAAAASAGDDNTARTAVLRTAVRHADDRSRIDRKTLAAKTAGADGKPVPQSTLTAAINQLIESGALARVRNGLYEVTDRARSEAGAEARAAIDAAIGPDDPEPVEPTGELAGVVA